MNLCLASFQQTSVLCTSKVPGFLFLIVLWKNSVKDRSRATDLAFARPVFFHLFEWERAAWPPHFVTQRRLTITKPILSPHDGYKYTSQAPPPRGGVHACLSFYIGVGLVEIASLTPCQCLYCGHLTTLIGPLWTPDPKLL